MKNFNELQVGDTVVVFSDSNRYKPVERKVIKIGREYIHVESYYGCSGSDKFNKHSGCGEYEFRIHPGTLEEHALWKEEEDMWQKLRSKITHMYSTHLSKEQILRIYDILNE